MAGGGGGGSGPEWRGEGRRLNAASLAGAGLGAAAGIPDMPVPNGILKMGNPLGRGAAP